MKKLFILSLVFISFISYGQEAQKKDKNSSLNLKQKQRQSIDFILYYGTTDKFGFDFNLNTKTNYVFGFGFSGGLKGGIGKNYSETMGPNAFSGDIYEIKVRENLGFYGTFGYAFDKLTIGGKLGYGSSLKFFNAYDKLQILDPSGYYYTAQDAGGKVLSGVFMSYKLETFLSPYFGYDNFNGANFGIFFRL